MSYISKISCYFPYSDMSTRESKDLFLFIAESQLVMPKVKLGGVTQVQRVRKDADGRYGM